MKKHIADIVTACRIPGSVLLLFFPAFSAEFYVTYIVCGLSDMTDGTIARKTNNVSKFGAKFDTIADLVFVTVSLIKILPTLNIPLWLWIWGIVIAIIRIFNIVYCYISKKQFLSLHTIMNKITGLLLFLLPLTLSFIELKHSATAVCFAATFAAVQECVYITLKRENR